VSEDEVVAFRMLVPECNKICGIEIVRGPFALDGYWSLSAGRDDKVNLVPALGPKITALGPSKLARKPITRTTASDRICPHAWYNRAMEVIVKNRDILGGTPVFRGTRVPVQVLFDYLEGGETLEDFLEGFPTVSRESAVAALEEAKQLLLSRP
jgi:uncharacterized protein (DUF433 family)